MMIKNASVQALGTTVSWRRLWRVCRGAPDRLCVWGVAEAVGAGGVDQVDAVVG
jgi:hypothetical protein